MSESDKRKFKQQIEKQTSNAVALASIAALVILLALEVEIPTYIGVGLIGAALGAKWEQIADYFRGGRN